MPRRPTPTPREMDDPTADPEPFESWAIVELMGHRKLAGIVTEETRFGGVLGRVDVPQARVECRDCQGSGTVLPIDGTGSTCPGCDGKGHTGGGSVTVYFGASSVYAVTPTTEALARRFAETHAAPAPVGLFDLQLPGPKAATAGRDYDDDDDDYDPRGGH